MRAEGRGGKKDVLIDLDYLLGLVAFPPLPFALFRPLPSALILFLPSALCPLPSALNYGSRREKLASLSSARSCAYSGTALGTLKLLAIMTKANTSPSRVVT